MSADLLLDNGKIIDGTGSPWFRGAIRIDDGQIVDVSRQKNRNLNNETRVDLDGLVICPGFIDLHSHSDLRLFSSPELKPKVMQGITTEILGQDGFSMAPMYRKGGDKLWEDHLSGLNGRANKEWTWGSTSDYLNAIKNNGVAPNVGMLVGHGTVRFNIMGMDDRKPNNKELEEMKELIFESLEQGALGFSTGLVYTPQVNASTEEVQELASCLSGCGRPFVAHIRNEHSNIWSALDEFIDIGSAEDIPLHLSHFKTAGSRQHGKSQRAIEIIESARERGVDITADQYPYTAGSTMLASFLPSWVRTGSAESTINRLQQSRKEVVNYVDTETEPSWDEMVITSVQTEANDSYVGMSVTDIAADMDVTPPNAVIDLLIDEKLEVEQYSYHSIEEDVANILEYKNSAIATDGLLGGKPHPRTYGTYPRVLGRYARELNTFSMEEAIRMMTSLPARIIGIEDKGIIRTGNDADLVVFDPEKIDAQATYENPKKFPTGIHYVFINGTAVVNKGKHTGQTPGTVLSKSL